MTHFTKPTHAEPHHLETPAKLVSGPQPRNVPPPIPNERPVYDSSSEVACPACSHDGCIHFHSAQRRLSRRDAQGFLRFTENTLFTKHSRGEMPSAVSGPPLEFDTCHLAAFKYDGVVLDRAVYDRAAHLKAVPAAHRERERRKAAKHAKLSKHMRRRHAEAQRASATEVAGKAKRSANRGGAR